MFVCPEFPEFSIVCVPEIPTIVMSSGVNFPGLDAGEKLVEFEINVLRLQLQMEDTFTNIAKSTGRQGPCLCTAFTCNLKFDRD